MTYPLFVHYITALCVSSILAELTEAADNLAAKMKETGTRSGDQSYDYISNRQKEISRLLEKYDPRVSPNFEDDFPTKVLVQLRITSIDAISESNMDFTVSMFLRQTWNDSRLAYDPLPNIRSLELDTRYMDKVWVPDIFMPNEKSASIHLITVPNKLMHIYPEGKIIYSVRVTATLKCSMDLRKYPLDSQSCDVVFESYGYSRENLDIDWNTPAFIQSEGMKLPQFSLGDLTTGRCDKTYIGVEYTCIHLQFDFHRRCGYYITQIYIPSILIVILSWVSFWLDIDAVPARISLGVLTVLTMTTQSSGARDALPKVSYVKAIDVWMAMCLVFVFLALLQFAYVNVLSRVQRRRESVRPQESARPQGKYSFDDSIHHCNGNGENSTKPLYMVKKTRFSFFSPDREKARNIDRLSRVIFPTVFIIFNFVYWLVYIFWKPDRTEV